ncbi:glycosyl transferase family protein [Yersinia mollaretii]|uniref:glycosyltransferase family 2 protein n=1 Tax=Yersinia mollaretii TaxID=33060 RepID=UPI0005E98F3F|nr:glycosyltransferase family 2 protein [Yersinia mollaretii]CNK27563.1 glycosyl transferase family protein [Yersinia mollaretii]
MQLISICIPSLNRSSFLFKALESIYNQEPHDLSFEVCISNNNSVEDYSSVESYIEKLKIKYENIKYIKQNEKLSLDRHMHYVTSMAEGDYIYYLGDDDFFYPNAFYEINFLIKKEKVDLVIFNGSLIDANDNIIGKSYNMPARYINSLDKAFMALRFKSTFGAILVRRTLISDYYYKLLYGSSHAYCCFWLTMLNNKNWNYTIIVPDFNCVYLRMAEKNYNKIDVYYKDIFYFINVFSSNVQSEKAAKLISSFRHDYVKSIYSISIMSNMFRNGAKYKDIKICSSSNAKILIVIRKVLARILAIKLLYEPTRSVYLYLKYRCKNIE